MTDLLPCPFCGGAAIGNENGNLPYLYCESCDISQSTFDTVSESIAAWNTRTPTPVTNTGAVKVKPLVGWVIANGQGNRWRCVWKWETNAEWTDDISMAIKFATRDDAEAFSADDEDAWLIQEVSIPAIETTPDPRDAVIARLVEAAELADAALRGANMNMNVVQAKMSAALAAAKEVME